MNLQELSEIKARIGAAFEMQHSNIKSDLAAVHRRGTVYEAAMEGRSIENRRMLAEVVDVLSQIECDIENGVWDDKGEG